MRPGMTPAAPFIGGVPRSGTTLLRLRLDAHPELAIPPEIAPEDRTAFERESGDLREELGYETAGRPAPGRRLYRFVRFRRWRTTRGSASGP
jgi:hypothetical protein